MTAQAVRLRPGCYRSGGQVQPESGILAVTDCHCDRTESLTQSEPDRLTRDSELGGYDSESNGELPVHT